MQRQTRQMQFKMTPQHTVPGLDFRDRAWRLRFELADSGRILFEEDAFETLTEVEEWLLDFVRATRALVKDARESMAEVGVTEAQQ